MKRLALIIIALSIFQTTAQAAVPAIEREALVALYNSTNGAEWRYNSNWLMGDPCTNAWYGVTCDQSDTITGLYLSGNLLFGSIPTELGNLASLRRLNLSWNRQLHGSLPSTLGNLTSLWEIQGYASSFSGSLPAELGSLVNLKRLVLWGNDLSGTIPPELGNLPNLDFLNLSSNQLSGQVPAELGNLANLRRLYLHGNLLSGPIPPELGNLTELQELYLPFNRLNGSIPPELGNMTKLEVLLLQDNRLSGAIPSEIGSLTNLSLLFLENNKLSGSIPTFFRKTPKLQSITLRYNALYTDDAALDFILNGKSHLDWSATQTIAPKMVSVSGVGAHSVTLAWNLIEFTYGNGGYRVWYGSTPGGPYIDGGITDNKGTTSHTVSGLDLNQDYYFVVTAESILYGTNSNTIISENSNEVYVRTALARPTGIKATDGIFVDVVKVNFNLVEGATVYRVFRCLDRDQSCGSPIGYPMSGTFDDRKAVPGTVYYYRVRACTTTACGKFSVADSGFATIQPERPTRIRATDGTYSDRVQISWDGVEGATVYRVFRCLDSGPICGSPIGFPNGTSFDDTQGDPGTVYYYRIKACTTQHCSKFSVLNAGHRSDAPSIEDDAVMALMLPGQDVPIPALSTWSRWLLIMMTLGFGMLLAKRGQLRRWM